MSRNHVAASGTTIKCICGYFHDVPLYQHYAVQEAIRATLTEKGPSTMSNLDEMERLLEAATPLDFWQPDGKHGIGAGGLVITCGAYNEYGCGDTANRDLIVAAVNSLAALIAIARRAEALEKALDEILATVYSPDIDTYTDKSYSALHLKAIRIAQQARATLTEEGAPR